MEELIATNEGGNRLNLPAHPEGQYAAICVDVIDRGKVKEFNKFQGKDEMVPKVTLRFFCGEYHEAEDGKKYALWVDKWFRLSMNEKATLRKFIGQWRGRPISDAEAKRYNVAALLHQSALLQISHNVTPDRTYANIDTIMKAIPGMETPSVPADYVRIKDRPPREEHNGNSPMDRAFHANRKDQRQAAPASPFDGEDDDLPF
jgi:hypothetical protein